DTLLHDLYNDALLAEKQARLRTNKDIDLAATATATACGLVLDPAISDSDLRAAIFALIPTDTLQKAVANIDAMVRPPDDVYYRELGTRYRTVRTFLPTLLQHIQF